MYRSGLQITLTLSDVTPDKREGDTLFPTKPKSDDLRIMKMSTSSSKLLAFIVLSVFPSLHLSPVFAGEAPDQQVFTIDDYFKIQKVVELSLSSDGAMLAYAVESESLEENKTIRNVYISATASGAEPILIDTIQKAKSLNWIPGTHELAFLLSAEGADQVYSIDTKNNKIRQHTYSDDTIERFSFAPYGASLAWLKRTDPDFVPSQISPDYKRSGLYERLFYGEEGVVIDSENTWAFDFLDSERLDSKVRPSSELWLKRTGTETFQVEVPGQVKRFYWSSDASKLSITYAADYMPKEDWFSAYSLGVFDIMSKSFGALARARPRSEMGIVQYYNGGEWVPGENQLFVRRTIKNGVWGPGEISWALINLDAVDVLEDKRHIWKETEIYSRDSEPAFVPVDKNIIYSNKTLHARKSLYQITSSSMEKADILKDVQGSVSMVRFSIDFEKAVFVNQSLTRPPEIYIWRKGFEPEKLSRLHKQIDEKQLPRVKEVTWKSKDEVAVQGWLLEPVGDRSDNNPWPLVTFVHGGPGFAASDEFAFYFKTYGGLWPYPLEVYALKGMAVFIPNYRGTRTFGNKFGDPKSLDGEPIDDIVSGIEHLIAQGIADPNRLAISGHSHGAWLGPMVMMRNNIFRTGSFAEFTQNFVLSYSLSPGYLNRDIQDIKLGNGASLYEDPQRYIDISPEFHYAGLGTAVLFEAGAKSMAVHMMGAPKAARRAGMPVEFVVYPQTGHNIKLPRLQKESAERNLDWFRFWLLGGEDPNPAKARQYERWRKLRSESEKDN